MYAIRSYYGVFFVRGENFPLQSSVNLPYLYLLRGYVRFHVNGIFEESVAVALVICQKQLIKSLCRNIFYGACFNLEPVRGFKFISVIKFA